MQPPDSKGREKQLNLGAIFEADFVMSREGGFRPPLYLVQLPFVYLEIVVI